MSLTLITHPEAQKGLLDQTLSACTVSVRSQSCFEYPGAHITTGSNQEHTVGTENDLPFHTGESVFLPESCNSGRVASGDIRRATTNTVSGVTPEFKGLYLSHFTSTAFYKNHLHACIMNLSVSFPPMTTSFTLQYKEGNSHGGLLGSDHST